MRLPLFIQRRTYSFRKYVNEKLFPDSYVKLLLKGKKADERKLTVKSINLIIDECSYACFIFSLKQFFLEGTKAAQEATRVFKELGVNEFFIGKKDYSENNNNVLEGKQLYEIMIATIQDKQLRELIENSNYFSEIIDRYRDVSI